MQLEVWAPAVTAALTLLNTIVLVVVNRRTSKTHQKVNGMQLQLLAEAEARGRRQAAHASRTSVSLGE